MLRWPFRAAAVLLAVFCALHTWGGMLRQESLGAEADAVFAQMKEVPIHFGGAICTWYGFWFGFGLSNSIFLAFSALLAWQLGNVPRESWRDTRVMAWALVAAQSLQTILSARYFFAGPVIFGVLITALLTLGNWRKQRAHGG